MIFWKKFACLLFFAAFLSIIINCGAFTPQQADIKLNLQQKFQTITGWEATAQAGEFYSAAFENYKEKLFDEAVNDLGINRLRIEVKSGNENPVDYFQQLKTGQITEEQFNDKRYEAINDNDDPFVINPKGFQFSQLDSTIEQVVLPIKRLLAQRGETLYLNLNFVDFGKNRGDSNIRHDANPEEYAEFILASYQHLQNKYGFVPDAIEVILEPDTNTDWTATDIGLAIVATAKRLQAHKFKPAFIAPSTTNAANTPIFIDEIAKVPDAMQYIAEFSYHRYSGASEEVLREITNRATKYGKNTAMLEWIGADYNALHEDLKIGNNSAWQQFTLAFPNEPDNGAQYYQLNTTNTKNPIITIGSRTKFLRQYFRYIRTGAQRIGAESTNANLDPLAFINANGKYVLVVKSKVSGTVSVQGLPAGIYGISYTTSNQSDVTVQDVVILTGETLSANIPSLGVLTIYAK